MLSSFCSPLNSIPDIPGIISVVTADFISVVIGAHLGGGDHCDGGDHFGGGTDFTSLSNKLEKQESNFALKIMLCQAGEMNSYVQQLQLATRQIGAKGLV